MSRHGRIRIGITLASSGRIQDKTDSLVGSLVQYQNWFCPWDGEALFARRNDMWWEGIVRPGSASVPTFEQSVTSHRSCE